MKRIGILLTGNIRTISACTPSLKSFLSNCNADIFVGTYNLQYGYHPWVAQSTGFISDEILSREQIVSMLNPIKPRDIIVDDHSEYVKKMSAFIGKAFLPHEYGSLMQFFKMNDVLSSIKNYETENGFKYDALIKTRCDLSYLGQAPIDRLFGDEIVVDTGNVFPNDCVLLGSRNSMVKVIETMAALCRTIDDRNSYATKDIPHGLLHMAVTNAKMNFVEMPLIKSVVRWNKEVSYPPCFSELRK